MKRKKNPLRYEVPQGRKEQGTLKIFKNKNFVYGLSVFFLGFLLSIIIVIRNGPLDLYPAGADSSYYVQIGQWINNIFKDFFHFLYGFITNTFTKNDYYQYGFIDSNPISSIFRSPVYGLYLAVILSLFGLSNESMLFSQAFLNGLLFLLVFRIVHKLTNKKIAVISILLLLFHVSVFTIVTGASSETFLTVVILSYVYLTIVALEKANKKYYFFSGLCITLIILIKPSMAFYFLLAVPFIGLMIYLKKITFKEKKRFFVSFLSGFLMTFLIWVFIFYRTTGKLGFTASGLAGVNLLAGSNPYYGGWSGNTMFLPPEFRKTVKEKVRSIPESWYQYYSDLANESAVEYIKNHPVPWLGMAIKKSFTLLLLPSYNIPDVNIFRKYRENLFPLYHRILILFFLFFLIFFKKFMPVRVLIGSIFLYLMGLHSMAMIDSRYFFPLIPFLVMSTSLVISEMRLQRLVLWIKAKRQILLFFLFLMINAVVLFLTGPRVLSALMNGPGDMKIFQTLIRNALFLVDSIILFKILLKFYSEKGQRVLIIIFLAILVFLYNVFNLTNPQWSRWHQNLRDIVVTQKIIMPEAFNKKEYDEAYIIIDLMCHKGNGVVTVDFNNTTMTDRLRPTNDSAVLYQKESKWYAGEPQWLYMPVNIADIRSTNIIGIWSRDDDCMVFGENLQNKKELLLPSFIYYIYYEANGGVEKFYGFDRRVYLDTKLLSSNNDSFVLKKDQGHGVSSPLLSDKGRYNVFLLLKRKGGYYMDRRYSPLMNYHPKLLALLSIMDQGIVKWLMKPSENDIKAEGPVQQILMSETDRFYSGYDLY